MEAKDHITLFISWFNSNVADGDVPELDDDEVYLVWYNFTLGNSRSLISTTRPDHKYYEVTHNNNTGEFYVDTYLKVAHKTLPDISILKIA